MLRLLSILIGVAALALAVGLALMRPSDVAENIAAGPVKGAGTPPSAATSADTTADLPTPLASAKLEETGLPTPIGEHGRNQDSQNSQDGPVGPVVGKTPKPAPGQDGDSAQAALWRSYIATRPYLGQKVELVLTDGRRVSGALINADPQTVQLLAGDQLVILKWNDIRAAPAVAAMKIILAPMTGEKHLDVAKYLLARDEPQLFIKELELVKDPKLAKQVADLMQAWQQIRDNRFASGAASIPVSPIQWDGRADGLNPPPPGTYDTSSEIQRVEEDAVGKAKLLHISQFNRIPTDHFLIFHTWDSSYHDKLKWELEKMYEDVVRMFGVPGYQNLFAGKCPVYVVTDFNQFRTLCQAYNFTPAPNVLGVTVTSEDGRVRMLMYWSGDESRFWQTVAHEGTHAVLHRYRSPAHVDVWLNEGFAEYVAATLHPESGKFETARVYGANFARRGISLDNLFSSRHSPPGPYYPICLSLVDYLIRLDGRAFAALLAGIKDGKTTEQALLDAYRMNLAQMEASWREWAKTRVP